MVGERGFEPPTPSSRSDSGFGWILLSFADRKCGQESEAAEQELSNVFVQHLGVAFRRRQTVSERYSAQAMTTSNQDRGLLAMVAVLISDDLWNLIAPLLPPARSEPKGGRPAHTPSSVSARGCICPSNRHPLGDAPQGTGLRLWNDLLAPPAGLAGGGRLGFDSFRAPRLACSIFANRLV
jgi:hypothetical protein